MRRARSLLDAFKKLYGTHVLSIAALAAIGFLNGFLGVLGVTALVPLFAYLTHQDISGGTGFLRWAAWGLDAVHARLGLGGILVVVVLLFVLKALLLFVFKYVGLRVTSNYELHLRTELYRASLGTSWSYLLRQKIGYFENVLMIDVGAAVKLISVVLGTLLNVTGVLVYLSAAFWLSPWITAIALFAGAGVLGAFRPFTSSIRSYARANAELNKDITHEINENGAGMKVIKAAGVEEPLSRSTIGFFRALRNNKIRVGILRTSTNVAIQPLTILFVVVLFSVFSRRPDFHLAAFLVVLYLIQQIFLFVEKLQNALQETNELTPFVKHVLLFQRQVIAEREIDRGALPFRFEHDLEFRDVAFGYGERKRVLEGVSFRIPRGAMAGIIGPSGAGKTTVVDLLLRLFDPVSGSILLDGRDAKEIQLRDWRARIGYVPQDIFLKNETIADNIRFYDSSLGDAEIREAARTAQIYDFIMSLPLGFSTIVGERGVLFSVGQRQRIVLARSLARRPSILVLDEATSALDAESESLIKRALEALRGRTTVVIIAHRLSTVRGCDRLIALERGRVAEEGAPADLLRDRESYFSRVYRIS